MVAVPAGHQHLFGHPQHPSMRRRRSSNPSLAPNSCARRYPTSPLPETSAMSSSLCRISTNDPRSQPLPVAGAPAGAPLCCPAFSACFVPRVSGVFRRFRLFPAVSGCFVLAVFVGARAPFGSWIRTTCGGHMAACSGAVLLKHDQRISRKFMRVPIRVRSRLRMHHHTDCDVATLATMQL